MMLCTVDLLKMKAYIWLILFFNYNNANSLKIPNYYVKTWIIIIMSLNSPIVKHVVSEIKSTVWFGLASFHTFEELL